MRDWENFHKITNNKPPRKMLFISYEIIAKKYNKKD